MHQRHLPKDTDTPCTRMTSHFISDPTPARRRAGLTAGDGPDDKQRFGAGGNRLRQWCVGRFVRNVFPTRKEAQKRPALLRQMIANCPAQHRIARFDRVHNRPNRYRSAYCELNFASHVRQGTKMRWQHHAYRSRCHAIVWTSTDNTAGRSRTMGFHVSPASAEQYTWPPVVPK